MQLSHVFIAFLARDEWFPFGIIAFPLFVFLGVPRWLPRAIFCDFDRPLGAFWALFGSCWGPLSTLGVPLGALLAPFWWPCWSLGAFCDALVAILACLGPQLWQFGCPNQDFATILASYVLVEFTHVVCPCHLHLLMLICRYHILFAPCPFQVYPCIGQL